MKKQLVSIFASGLCVATLAMSASAGPVNFVNPGFEADAAPTVGASGWTISSGGTDWFTTTAGAPDSNEDPDVAFEGVNWLSGNRLATAAGSSSNPQTITQQIDISADAAIIDTGGVLNIGFQFADSDANDNAFVNVSFFSDVAGNTPVGTLLESGLLDPTGVGATAAPWAPRSLSGLIPVGARSLEVELVVERLSGSAGNIHFDDFNGSVTAVPEPTSLAVLSLGVCGVVARRRRKRS